MSKFSNSQSYTISAACGCNKGLRRSNNEDNFYFDGDFLNSDNDGMGSILTRVRDMTPDSDETGSFFAVYDGMGGGQYGELASHAAAAVTEGLLDSVVPLDADEVLNGISEMCMELNNAVFDASTDLVVNQMGSTLVGCYFYGANVWCCNVGDSRSFRLRDGVLMQLSVDHTDADTMQRSGVKGRKPYLTQYLGVDPEEMRICPEVSQHDLNRGDAYLICSDGLTDMVTEERITEILMDEGDEEEKVQTLMVEALRNGGKDNVTVILCTIN